MADENAPSQKTVLGRSKIFTPEVIDDIHMKAELGRYRMRGFSMFKKIPHWDDLLQMSARCCELAGLGYIGVDFVLDRDRGPMILELNARPGLAIQIANGNGLLHRLRHVEAARDRGGLPGTAEGRVEFAREAFPTRG